MDVQNHIKLQEMLNNGMLESSESSQPQHKGGKTTQQASSVGFMVGDQNGPYTSKSSEKIIKTKPKLEIIMSAEEYILVDKEYKLHRKNQKACWWIFKRFLSTTKLFKYIFRCKACKVEDKVNIPYQEMTDLQKRHRIKYLWKVARLIKTYDQMKIRNEAMRELLSEDDE